jgi:hypothetical protein
MDVLCGEFFFELMLRYFAVDVVSRVAVNAVLPRCLLGMDTPPPTRMVVTMSLKILESNYFKLRPVSRVPDPCAHRVSVSET